MDRLVTQIPHQRFILTRPIIFETLRKRKAFPGFGTLKSFLLASDYAISGKATTPLPASVGKIIYEIGRGSAQGLSRLGFACTDIESTVRAFTVDHHYLKQVIPDHRRQFRGNICGVRTLDLTPIYSGACIKTCNIR